MNIKMNNNLQFG